MNTQNTANVRECNLYFLPAGNGDCILIQYQDADMSYHNILIDGGNRNRLEFNKQKKKLLEVLDNGCKGRLDLVIVTHSDDDHIEGILKLVQDEELSGYVDRFWFNSEKAVSELFSSSFHHTQPYLVGEEVVGVERSSRNQDNDLYSKISKESKWSSEVIYSPKKETIGSLSITVLSPNIEKLKVLDEYWPKMPINSRHTNRSSSCISDHNEPLEELYQKLGSFKEDTSPVNGASIALMLEWGTRRWLLLSDSHPSVVSKSIRDILPKGKSSLPFDVVKVSHHGSRNNTSDELLDLIDCEHFVVTTNGNRHCHPNKDCLARIININPERTNIYFNYDNETMRNVFDLGEFENVKFPEFSEEGIRFKYES